MIWTNEKSVQKDGTVEFKAPQFTIEDEAKTLKALIDEINAKEPGVDVRGAMRAGLLLKIPAARRGGAGKKVEDRLNARVVGALGAGNNALANEILAAMKTSLADAAKKYL